MSQRSGPLPPDFLILGAQKCGTTSLAAALRTHPQVFIPAVKEAHHFGKVDDAEVGGRAYRRFFSEWDGQPVVGEATPNYLLLPRSAEQICRFLPEVKGIVLLRNPVDRAYSGYWHSDRVGLVPGPFEEVIDREMSDPVTSLRRFGDLVIRGHYAEQLQRYLDLGFDRERLLVLFFEEMRSDGAGALCRVQEFLGIDVVLTEVPHRNEASRSGIPRRLRRHLTPRRHTLLINRFLRATRRPFVPPPMDPEVRARLVEHYRPHNARLAELLGRDLPGWDR